MGGGGGGGVQKQSYNLIRDITPKLSKSEQPFLYETHCLNLIYIAIKFHHDNQEPYIVTECNRIALQTAIVYFYKEL